MGGGVSNNTFITRKFSNLAKEENKNIFWLKKISSDNAP